MIRLRDIQKSYPMGSERLPVLKGIGLDIQAGEFVAIMGPSGSGKSTLMNLLGLLDNPDSGSFQLEGKEISSLGERDLAVLRRQTIGFIFQQFNLLPRLSALENVALPLLYSQGRVEHTAAKALLERVGLGSRMGHQPNELSGGQQQRVAIARALVNQPRILLADEPTGNLDSQSSEEILTLIRELNDQGITILLVTHEEDVAVHAKRLIRLRDGVIHSDTAQAGTKGRELKRSERPVMAERSRWSEVWEYCKQGLRALNANKIRTGLSMLGILIGVAAVIAMLALGRGAQRAIESQLAALGSNLIVVRPTPIRIPGGGSVEGTELRITLEDAQALESTISSVRQASAAVEGRAQMAHNNKNWSSRVSGVSPAYARMHSVDPQYGRFFSDRENQLRSLVAVIGVTIVRELFGEENPIGKLVKINKVNFEVIGILPERGASAMADQDDQVFVPINAAMHRLLGKPWVDFIDVEVKNPEQMADAQESIKSVLYSRHVIPLSQHQDAFRIRNMADIQAALSESNRTMSILLASIAAISLLVGGIGIMNIMLMAVTERTREIGLRKAIGAQPSDILIQFLIEAAVVGVLGGAMGIVLGVVCALLMSYLAGWPTSISPVAVAVSFFFSAAIGIAFGAWPARKASMLQPIAALRYE